jgi:protein-serine/threonine kinase
MLAHRGEMNDGVSDHEHAVDESEEDEEEDEDDEDMDDEGMRTRRQSDVDME